MAVIVASRQKANYSVIPNAVLRATELSYRDRGLLAWMLSHADGYSITIESACRAGREGKEAIRVSFQRLEKAGYIKRIKHRNELGHVRTTTYVYDTPQGVEVSDVPNESDAAPKYASSAAQLVAEIWEPRMKGKTAQPAIAVVKIVGSALHNGMTIEAITSALIKIAEKRETVTIHRLNTYVNGESTFRGQLVADQKKDWSEITNQSNNGEIAL
jgi:hypothetical protein